MPQKTYYKLKRQILKIFSHLRLKKIKGWKNKQPPNVIGFCTLRNELVKIKRVLNHYRKIGCEGFVILDNGSTDGTVDYLLTQSDVTLYSTKEKYVSLPNGLSSKQRWMNILLNRYGINKWCIGFDADELFIYPNFESKRLHFLIDYLEKENFDCLRCLWIDMYSGGPIKDAYISSDDLLTDFPFFDSSCRNATVFERAFAWRSEFDKTPLFKWSNNISIDNGWHRVGGNARQADFEGAVLHFPFDSSLHEKATAISKSQNYFNSGEKYKRIANTLIKNNDYSLLFNKTIRFDNSTQLYENILKISEKAKKELLI